MIDKQKSRPIVVVSTKLIMPPNRSTTFSFLWHGKWVQQANSCNERGGRNVRLSEVVSSSTFRFFWHANYNNIHKLNHHTPQSQKYELSKLQTSVFCTHLHVERAEAENELLFATPPSKSKIGKNGFLVT